MSEEILNEKRARIDRLIETCKKNNWPYPRTCGVLLRTPEQINLVLGGLLRTVDSRSQGKRMRSDGVYF